MFQAIDFPKEQLQDLYLDKKQTIAQIAKALSVSQTCIRHNLIRHEIPRRRTFDWMIEKYPKTKATHNLTKEDLKIKV